MRTTTDPVIFFRALEEKPYDFDFFQALRRIECLFPDKPRLGQALRPIDEPIRFGQAPSMTFAPAALSAFILPAEDRPARMDVRFFGLLGPNGPLPLHLTEYARERLLHGGDATFTRFLDVLHHRFIELFYRAWAQAQPTVNFDRPKDDRFAIYVGAMFGLAGSRLRDQNNTLKDNKSDDVADAAKLFYAGLLSRHVRNRDGLAALLTGYFRIPIRIEEFSGHWMALSERERTRLGGANEGARLGGGTVLGARVWDRQHKIRLVLGPLTLAQYESFLPGGAAISKLVAWVRQYLCFELEWDAQLVLLKEQVPKTKLGKYSRLGWTTWLGNFSAKRNALDLTLDAERHMAKRQPPAAVHPGHSPDVQSAQPQARNTKKGASHG